MLSYCLSSLYSLEPAEGEEQVTGIIWFTRFKDSVSSGWSALRPYKALPLHILLSSPDCIAIEHQESLGLHFLSS